MAPAAQAPSKQEDKAKVVITPIGVACFVHVWEPFAFKPQPGQAAKEPSYSMMLVFEESKLKDDPAWMDLRKGVTQALNAKFGPDRVKQLQQRGKLALPWRNAAEYEDYGPPFEAGRKMIRVSSRNAPGVVDARSRPILNQVDFYAGCLARVSVLPWAYDTNGNQGCTLLLNNVQKAGDGERLAGGRVDPEKEFAPLEAGGGDNMDEDDLIG